MSGSTHQGPAPRHAAVQRVASMNIDGNQDTPGRSSGSQAESSQGGHSRSTSGVGNQAGGHSRSNSGVGSQVGGHSRSNSGVGSQAGGHSRSNSGVGSQAGGHSRSNSGVSSQAGGHSRSNSGVSSQAGGSQRGSPRRESDRSRAESGDGAPSGSQTSNKPNPFGPSEGFDPAIDPNDPNSSRPQISHTELVGKLIDLPADAFKVEGVDARFAKRPGFNSEGKAIKVQLNIFSVTDWPTKDIYQYDINVVPNPKDSRSLVKKVWKSPPVQEFLKSVGGKWLYDGNKLAWNSKPVPRGEHRLAVDLDALSGKTVIGKDGVYHCQIKQATKIRMEYLRAYLKGEADWDSHVLECINFLDHLMRQWPSENLIAIKRNFYDSSSGRPAMLDNYTYVRKGTYAAIRMGEYSTLQVGGGLAINVDVANTAFWTSQTAAIAGRSMLSPPGARSEQQLIPWGKMADALRPVRTKNPHTGRQHWVMSEGFKTLRRLAKLRFTVNHRGKMNQKKIYTIKNILFDGEKYGAKGADSLTVSFDRRNKDGTTQTMTIFEYFLKTYNGRLQYPDLPLLETTRDGIFPLEVCTLEDYQKYQYKLTPEQTSQMIKIAVSRPKERNSDIMSSVRSLNWNEDPHFGEYGLKVSPNMVVTNARLLQNPEVYFSGSKINPGVTGRWDLRGKRFLEVNVEPLKSWGFIGCGTNDSHAVQQDQLMAFAQVFVRTYKGHGGRIEKNPFVKCYPYTMNYAEMASQGYKETGDAAKSVPQILFFVVSTKNQLVYERIKKNMDCRLCTVSQVMLADHVKKANGQYCSNVSMKVNAKLGGITCRAAPVGIAAPMPYYKIPTMFIGLDVSHASPGSTQPSMAAMTVSTDKNATKYAGSCETNGWRVEIVNSVTMRKLFEKLLKYWVTTNGCSPQHIYYFRDGVSEGQFQHVIDYEIKDLKRMFLDVKLKEPKFTVLVATKRHHIRFFPKPGDAVSADKNANSHPGTLVEYNATHPFHFDFFLSSHSAIQGTGKSFSLLYTSIFPRTNSIHARPVHYHIILDSFGVKPNEIQKMIYHQCYQYARSTTPVSIHPAIYYAHLVSQRARAHEDLPASSRENPSGKAGFPLAPAQSAAYSGGKGRGEAPTLVPMNNPSANPQNIRALNTRMWYI